jgi:predicted extracellular nuclease
MSDPFMKILLCIAISLVWISCNQSQSVTAADGANHGLTIGFYNVENLFDTINDPSINDEDFTPSGKLKWDASKYETKLFHVAQVMDALPGELPVAMGLCEIENITVLEALIQQPQLRIGGYEIVHYDSPDERGIDVALLFRKELAQLQHKEYLRVALADSVDPNTRDILYVVLRIAGEDLHLFVNHWPSRSGGQKESEPKRIQMAERLAAHISKIQSKDPQAKILCMGDFNDYPTDISVSKYVDAGPSNSSSLYNYMWDAVSSNQGTHFYKGEWGALDQFIGSWSLVQSSRGLSAPKEQSHRFFDDLVLFKDKDGQSRPNRTYVGDSYKAGYSDHLAIYLQLLNK